MEVNEYLDGLTVNYLGELGKPGKKSWGEDGLLKKGSIPFLLLELK